jgi:hypothetical protein
MTKKCCNKEVGCSKTPEQTCFVSAPKEVNRVTGCKPCGAMVLLELLTAQEILHTKLHLQNNKANAEYQGYVISVGPNFNPDAYGFSLGDRVLVSGNGVPVPNYDDGERDRVLMEPFGIKAVLKS